MPIKVDLNWLSIAHVEKLISLAYILVGPSENRNGPLLVSANRALFGRKLPISPLLGSKSTSGLAEFPNKIIGIFLLQLSSVEISRFRPGLAEFPSI